MQTAKLTIVTSPENQLPVYGITPAEALILHKMHFRLSNGSPLKDVIVNGEARTIDVPAKNEVPEYFNPNIGKTIPAVPAVKEVSHPRTSAEEVERLKRKYTGNIKGDDGRSLPAFVATFGTAMMMQLPQTFQEIEGALKMQGQIAYPKPEQEVEHDIDHATGLPSELSEKDELMAKTRAELVGIAQFHNIEVLKNDGKEKIADALLNAGYTKAATVVQ